MLKTVDRELYSNPLYPIGIHRHHTFSSLCVRKCGLLHLNWYFPYPPLYPLSLSRPKLAVPRLPFTPMSLSGSKFVFSQPSKWPNAPLWNGGCIFPTPSYTLNSLSGSELFFPQPPGPLRTPRLRRLLIRLFNNLCKTGAFWTAKMGRMTQATTSAKRE